MYIQISKYNKLNLYNVTYTYVFRAELLALDKQSMCLPLERAVSPAPAIPRLPKVLCVGLRPPGLFPIQFGMSISVIIVQFTFRQ